MTDVEVKLMQHKPKHYMELGDKFHAASALLGIKDGLVLIFRWLSGRYIWTLFQREKYLLLQ
jgi:hypothetical protein